MRWMVWATLLAGATVGVVAWLDRKEAPNGYRPAATTAIRLGDKPATWRHRHSQRVDARTTTAADSAEVGFAFQAPARFQHLRSNGSYYSYEAVAVGDVTGDGRHDVVAIPGDNEIHVLVQSHDGRLREPMIWRYADDVYLHPKELVLSDFNEDGVLDVATSSLQGQFKAQGGLNLLLSDRRGGLALHQTLGELERTARDWVVLDVDRDGHQDIIGFENVSDYSFGEECGANRFTCPRYRVMYGDGSGGFGRIVTVELRQPHTVRGIGARDVDGDGYLDLVMGLMGDPSNRGRVVVQRQDRLGGLLPLQDLYSAPAALGGGAVGDFNADGRADLLVKPTNQFDPTWILLQSAAATFAPAYVLPTYALRTEWPRAADFDGDEREDLALVQMRQIPGTTYFETIATVNLQRDGRLQAPVESQGYFPLDKVSTHRDALATGDINGDGCRDLVVAASYEGLIFLGGTGCRTVAPPPMSDPLPADLVGG